MVLAGAFTAYFGSGKSRTIGVVLLIIGLVVGILWVYLAGFTSTIDVWVGDVVWTAFVNILAAVIGALIAVGAFLLAIMKS
jgi:multisubunit Na+/H+ antiporter MnhG subunit